MKYFIISQPKSGTYLLANLLVEFGIKHSYMHLSEKRYQKYDPKNIDDAVRNPSKYSFESELKDSLGLIEEHTVAVGHIEHNKKNIKLLKGFKKILITREKNEIRKSWKRFSADYSRKPDLECNYKSIEKWKKERDVFHIEFNDIIKTKKEKLDKLQKHLFLNHVDLCNSVLCAKNAIQKDSITKSQFRGTKKKKVTMFEYFQIKFAKIFKR